MIVVLTLFEQNQGLGMADQLQGRSFCHLIQYCEHPCCAYHQTRLLGRTFVPHHITSLPHCTNTTYLPSISVHGATIREALFLLMLSHFDHRLCLRRSPVLIVTLPCIIVSFMPSGFCISPPFSSHNLPRYLAQLFAPHCITFCTVVTEAVTSYSRTLLVFPNRIATLERIRAFRRRHESPSPSTSPGSQSPIARSRSPAWLNKMHRSSSKRAHSPALNADEPLPKIPQLDGALFGKPPEPDVVENEISQSVVEDPPPIPAFLRLTDGGATVFPDCMRFRY